MVQARTDIAAARVRLYLAGPDVFLPDPLAEAARLKAICAAAGLEGVFPLDNQLAPATGETPAGFAARIRAANIALIRQTDGVIANVSPFRGPCVDDGTAFEIGFAQALGRPVFLWTAETGTLLERTRRRMVVTADGQGRWRDAEGMEVEEFGLPVNLMLIDPDQGPVHHGVEAAVAAARAWFSASTR